MKIIGIAVLTLILVFAFTTVAIADTAGNGMHYENEFDNPTDDFGPYDGNWVVDKVKKIIDKVVPGKAKGHDKEKKNKDKGKKVGHDKEKKDKGKKVGHDK